MLHFLTTNVPASPGLGVVVLLFILGCASTLPTSERMGRLAHNALRACKTDGSRCAAAQLCGHAAQDAAHALQKARQATAEGRVDPEASAAAAALPGAADAVCRSAGIGG